MRPEHLMRKIVPCDPWIQIVFPPSLNSRPSASSWILATLFGLLDIEVDDPGALGLFKYEERISWSLWLTRGHEAMNEALVTE